VGKVRARSLGFHIKMTCLIAVAPPSVNALHNILHVSEKELDWLDLTVNVSNFSCMRIGAYVLVLKFAVII